MTYVGFLASIHLVLPLLICVVALPGIVGAVQVVATRDDAFPATNRQSKWVWFAMLAGSVLAVLSTAMFLQVIGAVIIGIYWFDVRPGIRDVLEGNYGY